MKSFNRLLQTRNSITFIKQLRITLSLFIFLSFTCSTLYGENNPIPNGFPTLDGFTVSSLNEGFIATDNNLFQVKIYTLSEAKANEVSHWFFKLLDKSGRELNYAQIKIDGYLKTDSSIKLNHAGKIVPLGSDGKYIIKSIEMKQEGTWILKANINNLGQADTITYQIKVN